MSRAASFVALVLALVACAGAVPGAQEPKVTSGTVAVAEANTPLFPLPNTGATVRMLPAGTEMRVVERNRSFYKVVVTGVRGGQETGFVALASVHLQPAEPDAASRGPISNRGFLEGRGVGFVEEAPNDSRRLTADALLREELYVAPSRHLQLAAGIDLRANSYDQVEDEWRLDVEDRSLLRPRAALRRASASVSAGPLTIDAGKQFIRWGKADIVNPTDRFAPRDYLNVLDADFLPVLGVHASAQFGTETLEGVYLPRLTPSRLPLLDQRWTVVPAEAQGLALVDGGSTFPRGAEQGVRWNHTGGLFESSVSFFNGFNHLPAIAAVPDRSSATVSITRSYPELRSYGADLAIPTRVVTLKGEAAYFTSPSSTTEEYVLYVLEVERQTGEWLLDGGYAGDVVTRTRPGLQFGAERGLARSFIARAAYTVDPRRSVAIEGALRQDGAGGYVKAEYSQTLGAHWRLTASGVGIGGEAEDFLGQFRHNSHLALALRFSH